MYATDTSLDFKVAVIGLLEVSGLGYDTRFRYYRRQFPELAPAALARKVCEPIDYYYRFWPAWRAAHDDAGNEDE